jgi:hypothetical protein
MTQLMIYIPSAFSGSFHRGSGDGRRFVQDKNSLLLPGPNEGDQAVVRREELPHLLPDAGRIVPRRER